jgi:hypothetical protein
MMTEALSRPVVAITAPSSEVVDFAELVVHQSPCSETTELARDSSLVIRGSTWASGSADRGAVCVPAEWVIGRPYVGAYDGPNRVVKKSDEVFVLKIGERERNQCQLIE